MGKYDIPRYPPNFIFIDLDLANFNKSRDLKKSARDILFDNLV